MLWVECSQLVMHHPTMQSEEVEATVDTEEEIWMQTTQPVKRFRVASNKIIDREVEEMAENEKQSAEERAQHKPENAAHEVDEVIQGEVDEALWRSHEAAAFRDWEQWTVLSTPPSRPRRLRATVVLQHGDCCESLCLAKGRPVELKIKLGEVARHGGQ